MWKQLIDELTDTFLSWRGWKVIGAPEKVDLYAIDGTPAEGVLAEINTAWDYSVIDEKLAKELGLLDGEAVVEEIEVPQLAGRKRPLVMVSFMLGGQSKRSRWVVADRQKQPHPVVIGRHDLAGFLVQISEIV